VPLEIVWSTRARRRLEEIRTYIARDKPEAAARLGARIAAVIEVLKDFPHLGRAGIEPGVRELVIGGTPYIVYYRVRGRRVTIQTIWHGAQLKRRAVGNDDGMSYSPTCIASAEINTLVCMSV
jgi:plasmid stabilization system protein ParE